MPFNDPVPPSPLNEPWAVVENPPDSEYQTWILPSRPYINEDAIDPLSSDLISPHCAILDQTSNPERSGDIDRSRPTDTVDRSLLAPYDHAKDMPLDFAGLMSESVKLKEEYHITSHIAQDPRCETSQKVLDLNDDYTTFLECVQSCAPNPTIPLSLGHLDPNMGPVVQLSVQPYSDDIMRDLAILFFGEDNGDTSKSISGEGMTIPDVVGENAANLNEIRIPPFFEGPSSFIPTLDQYKTASPMSDLLSPVLLQVAFTAQSGHPDSYLRDCLDRVLQYLIYWGDRLEPSQQSPEGREILGAIHHLELVRGSIYRIFVDPTGKACLICGTSKTSIERSVGCVRKHLGHRPFVCAGLCTRCENKNERARFFTRAKLEEHTKGSSRRHPCPKEGCDTQVLHGNLKRHWGKKHTGEPFPVQLPPRKF